MRQKQFLLWGQALLWCLVIIFFGIIIVTAENTPLSKKIVEKKMTNHYQKLKIKEPLEEGKLIYDEKKKSLRKTYYQKQYPKHFFTIYYKEKQITDTYQKEFVKGTKIIKQRQAQLQKCWEKLLKEISITSIEITIPFLDELTTEEKEKVLNSDTLYSSGLYTVSIVIPSLEDEIVEATFHMIDEIASANNYLPKSYHLSFKKENKIGEITIEKEN